MATGELPPLEVLLLARIATAGEGRMSHAAAQRTLEPHLAPWFGPARRRARMEAAVTSLLRRAFLTGAEAGVLQITETGRSRLLRALGRRSLPARRAWSALRDVELVAAALGLLPLAPRDRARFRTADGLRAAVLRQAYDLPLPSFPTGTQVRKALAWKRLEVLLERPLDPARATASGSGWIVDALASDWLRDGVVHGSTRTLALLAARAVGARDPEARSLREAVLSGWVRDGVTGSRAGT